MAAVLINQIDIFYILIDNFYICRQYEIFSIFVGSMKTDTNLSLTALRYIVAVDTHRNFVRAAEACGVTQPTLSAGIRSIETALDVTIFDRGAHPVRPTALGEKIIAQARVTLAPVHTSACVRDAHPLHRGEAAGGGD